MTTLPPIAQVSIHALYQRIAVALCVLCFIQLAGPNGALFDGYWAMLDGSQKGHIDAGTSAAFLKKSQLREPVLHKVVHSMLLCVCVCV